MLCSAVFVECLVLNLCCIVMFVCFVLCKVESPSRCFCNNS